MSVNQGVDVWNVAVDIGKLPSIDSLGVVKGSQEFIMSNGVKIGVERWSCVGDIRPNDEDVVMSTMTDNGSKVRVSVIDGMGGHSNGELAAKMAAEAFHSGKNISLTSSIANADGQIAKTGIDMGATMVAVDIKDNGKAEAAWVGDARIYMIGGGGAEQISRDQSMVQTLVDIKQITAEEALNHPMKNIVLNSLGEGKIANKPEEKIGRIEMALPIDRNLLLCCDGLWEFVGASGYSMTDFLGGCMALAGKQSRSMNELRGDDIVKGIDKVRQVTGIKMDDNVSFALVTAKPPQK